MEDSGACCEGAGRRGVAAEVTGAQHLLPNGGHQLAVHHAAHLLLPPPQLPQVLEHLAGLQQGHDVVVQNLSVVEVDGYNVHQVVLIDDCLYFLHSF